ncbi:MAG: restriction endonuclease subunit S [Acidimicrobiaceae bacterium]|nr:restriction endonuclease subunit S [Acidimicrobiaceae bacterium]
MGEWEQQPLGQLFEVQLGKMLSNGSNNGPQYQYLANRNVQWGKIVIDDLGTMNFSGIERKCYRLQPGDLLICEGGEVGRAALWSGELSNCYFQNAIHRLRPIAKVSALFMRYYFEYAARRGLLRALTGQTSIGHLPRANLVRWHVPVPPLDEQQRIAEILDTFDETIRTTEYVITKLQVVSSAVQEQLVLSSTGPAIDLAAVAILKGGHGFPEDMQGNQTGSVPFYKVSDMNASGNRKFMRDANNYVEREVAVRYGWRLLPPGSVIFAKVGAALLGNKRRILTVDSIVDNNMMAAIPTSLVSTEWLYRWLQLVDFKNFVQIGALPSVNQKLIGELKLHLPSLEEQQRSAEILDTADDAIQATQQQLDKLQKLRAGLADDLLSGRVRTVAA